MPTFDVVNDRSDGSVEQWWGSIIQFVRTRVAKRRCRLKNHQSAFVARNGPQSGYGSRARKNATGVSIQLLIFLCYDTTGAIDVLVMRVGCQQADVFVGALWICSKFSGVGTVTKIR